MLGWHSLTLEKIYQTLQVTRIGLSRAEAERRLKHFGPNQPQLHKTPLWKTVLEPFSSVFVVVLLTAALVSALSNQTLDFIVICVIILINAVIFYVQQYTSNRVLRSLKSHAVQTIQVLRDGTTRDISSTELVPGDVILLNEGERVPADARLIETSNLQIDESSLTGESLPVFKVDSVLPADKPLYERTNMVFQGTHVTAGTARAIVVETGPRTEFGAIAKMASQEDERSPVQQKIDDIITKIVKAVAVLALIVFGLSLLRGIAPDEALRFALSLSVAAVPEGLPVALTVVILLGMRRMAKKQALVRNFKAIEDIGLVTVIVTDKTGTLTKNRLHVVEHWPVDDKATKQAIAKSLGTPTSSDPLDKATSEYAQHPNALQALKAYPFEQTLRMSGAGWKEGASYAIYLKGAPEHIINRSSLSPAHKKEAESYLGNYTAKGYRVLAIARLSVATLPQKLETIKTRKLEFVGLIAFADEIRSEAATAVAEALGAGIKVKMVTGDHFETANHVAQQVGLATPQDQVTAASELPKTLEALAKVLKLKNVFARVLPQQKFSILKALKSTEITAMT
ncbi:MAG: HAD-IC family P-type ATPase, partial [Candidatus Saccharimonadales bacterium]